jgi:hypothetical protein
MILSLEPTILRRKSNSTTRKPFSLFRLDWDLIFHRLTDHRSPVRGPDQVSWLQWLPKSLPQRSSDPLGELFGLIIRTEARVDVPDP